MKKTQRKLIFLVGLFILILCNFLLLSKDFFNGTYYLIDDERFHHRAMFSVDRQVVHYKSYSKDTGEIIKQKACNYSVTEIDGKKIIDIDCISASDDEYTDILCLYRKSIFFMCSCSETFWFVCPSAIAVQIILITAYVVLFFLLFKKNKNPLP